MIKEHWKNNWHIYTVTLFVFLTSWFLPPAMCLTIYLMAIFIMVCMIPFMME